MCIGLQVWKPNAAYGGAGKAFVEILRRHVGNSLRTECAELCRHEKVRVDSSRWIPRPGAIPGANFLAGIAAIEMIALGCPYILWHGFFCLNRPVGEAAACIAAAIMQGGRGASLFAAVAIATMVGHGAVVWKLQRGENTGQKTPGATYWAYQQAVAAYPA